MHRSVDVDKKSKIQVNLYDVIWDDSYVPDFGWHFLKNDNKSSGKSRNGEQDWREDALYC